MADTDRLAEAIERLAQATEATPKIPVAVALWDSELAGQFFRVSPAYFLRKIAPMPGFPEANRKLGHPRWKAAEVIAWFDRKKAA